MHLIKNRCTDPHFNLALDEYLLTQCDDEYFLFWQNHPSVIIGRNQDALAEINRDFLKQNNIDLVRRMSGGGAVFHDLGNVNFTYITPCPRSDFFNFSRFSAPILAALKSLSVNAAATGRNDLTIDGKKFSGNAQHLHHGRILHHGTLLYSSDLSYMQGALNVNPQKLAGNGVKSVKSRVTNIAEHCSQALTTPQFITYLENYILDYFPDITALELTPEQLEEVRALADKKYRSDDWNLMHMENYSIKNSAHGLCGTVCVAFDVENKLISRLSITGDFFGVLDIEGLSRALLGTPHLASELSRRLDALPLSDYISGADSKWLISLFF